MNKKGLELGSMLMIFLGIILGLVFIVAIADNQAPLTNTRSVTNGTVTFPENGSTLTLEGQALVGAITAVNATDGEAVPASNFSTEDFVQASGEYRLVLTSLDSDWNDESVNLSYTYEPVGYNSDGSNRTILGLVLIFFALAVFAIALPGVREWITGFK
jgi:hypothetical protein